MLGDNVLGKNCWVKLLGNNITHLRGKHFTQPQLGNFYPAMVWWHTDPVVG